MKIVNMHMKNMLNEMKNETRQNMESKNLPPAIFFENRFSKAFTKLVIWEH